MAGDLGAIKEAFVEQGTTGEQLMCLCAYVVLYFDGTFKENAQALLHFYESTLPLYKKGIRFFDVDGKNKPKKFKENALELMPFWASKECEDRGIFGLRLESGATKDDVSEKGFIVYDGISTGFVKLFLPPEFLLESPGEFLEQVKSAVGDLKILSGHGGYGTNIHSEHSTSEIGSKVYHLSRRYKGVDLFKSFRAARFANVGLTNIGWLTFVGGPLLDKVGGISALRQNLAEHKEIIIHEFKHGVMLQAAPAPSLGDTVGGESVASYHAVGRALKALRIPDDVLKLADHVGGRENTRAWLDRFYE
jgi:hypothetical protein